MYIVKRALKNENHGPGDEMKSYILAKQIPRILIRVGKTFLSDIEIGKVDATVTIKAFHTNLTTDLWQGRGSYALGSTKRRFILHGSCIRDY